MYSNMINVSVTLVATRKMKMVLPVTMKAAVSDAQGSSLLVKYFPLVLPKDGGLLIKVFAVGVYVRTLRGGWLRQLLSHNPRSGNFW
jgi:hypothetical protein